VRANVGDTLGSLTTFRNNIVSECDTAAKIEDASVNNMNNKTDFIDSAEQDLAPTAQHARPKPATVRGRSPAQSFALVSNCLTAMAMDTPEHTL